MLLAKDNSILFSQFAFKTFLFFIPEYLKTNYLSFLTDEIIYSRCLECELEMIYGSIFTVLWAEAVKTTTTEL